MKKNYTEVIASLISFVKVIKHTKDNLEFVKQSKDDCENLDALIVNIKNALILIEEDVKSIDKHTLTKYVKDIKKSKELISFIMNKSISNVESIIASLPKDNYDSMSKEELIALLREKQ